MDRHSVHASFLVCILSTHLPHQQNKHKRYRMYRSDMYIWTGLSNFRLYSLSYRLFRLKGNGGVHSIGRLIQVPTIGPKGNGGGHVGARVGTGVGARIGKRVVYNVGGLVGARVGGRVSGRWNRNEYHRDRKEHNNDVYESTVEQEEIKK